MSTSSSIAARRVPVSELAERRRAQIDVRFLSSPCHAPTHPTSYLRARVRTRRSTDVCVALLIYLTPPDGACR